MKKTVFAIVLVVLLTAVGVSAYYNWGHYSYDSLNYYSQPYTPYYYSYYSPPYYDAPAYYGYEPYYAPYETPYYAPYETPYYNRVYYNPLGNYRNSYLSPLSSDYMYRYGLPQTEYAAMVYTLPGYGSSGELCGMIRGQQEGCVSGLVCDYRMTNISGVGVCSKQAAY